MRTTRLLWGLKVSMIRNFVPLTLLIQLFLCHRSAFVDISRPTVVCSRILSCKSGSELRLFDHPKVEVNRKRVISTRSSANIARSAGNNVGHEFLDGTEKARTSSSKFALEKFGSIIFSDAEQTVLGGKLQINIRCSVDIPSDWLFLDTLPLARELRRSNGLNVPSKASLQGLREYYEIPLQGSAHRAMADVHLLTEILERLACDLNLTISDLLGRAFKASDLIYEEKKG
ncbi:unnamed protein product [Dovyalis caffra]|uniref:Exonuclease domain-containing protein n=1 Tax=Dovyalis caffra TaxID=77055 RepID=A0AAV1RCV0_9ROSI|nr:unnamed protein product [Dovyalis caffra]